MDRSEQISAQRARRVVLTGAAGLIGQNLVPRLKARGFTDIVAIDKHPANTEVLARLHPDISVIKADLANDDGWQDSLQGAEAMIVGHAQIGGIDPDAFVANNLLATERLLAAAKAASIRRMVHISSSVVNSAAVDFYTESKKAQERIILDSGIPCVVLRPTLMFGWFDRKHLGWLARFMARVPVFPVPGNGRYLRQPLYAGDFCNIIMACLDQQISGQVHNISGLEKIDYIDLIRTLRDTLGLRTPIVKIPYHLFWLMLKTYSLINRDPPFTTTQLKALITPDVFEVIDWPKIFGVTPTSLRDALRQTYFHPQYSEVVLEF